MKTVIRLVALLGALALAAASGSSGSKSSGSSNSNIVSSTITLDNDTSVVPALANGAGIGNCQVSHTEQNKMAAKCHNGTIAIIQEGKDVTFGCPDISLEQCKAVFRYILDNTPTK